MTSIDYYPKGVYDNEDIKTAVMNVIVVCLLRTNSPYVHIKYNTII